MWNKKNLNKVLIGAFLWTALWWLWLFSRTKKWKNFFQKIQSDVKLWFDELKKTINNLTKKNAKKK